MGADSTTPHEECLPTLRKIMDEVQRNAVRDLALSSELQGHVIISTMRVVAPGLAEEIVVCPHGVRYWCAPDAELQRSMRAVTGQA